jgi:hypothetical protein
MEPEKEVNLLHLIRKLNRQGIRYLIIGRRAVILYGGPVLTADHDLWIHPADKKKALSFLSESLGFELSDPPGTKRPVVTGFSGMKKYDLFFQKSVRNIENETIAFETCYKSSTVLKDSKENVEFRIPSIDDLIRLKKKRPPNAKDEQDIEYLLRAKQLLRHSLTKDRRKK